MIILKKQKQLLYDANLNLLKILEEFLAFSQDFKDLSLYKKIEELAKEIRTATSECVLSCEITKEVSNPYSDEELEIVLIKLQLPIYFKQYNEYIAVVQKIKMLDEQLKVTKQITLVTNLINEKKKATELYNNLHPQFQTKLNAIKSEMPEIKARYRSNKLASWDPKIDINRIERKKETIQEKFTPLVRNLNYEFFSRITQDTQEQLLLIQEGKKIKNKKLRH